MANGLSTGIGLSGQLKVDDSGQQRLLEAEKAQAGQRLAEQAKLDKEQKDLEKEVYKNLSFSQNLKIPRNQSKAEQVATSSIARIVSGMKNGELAMGDVYREVAKSKSKTNAIAQMDEQQAKAFETYAKDPSSYGKRTVIIKGKEYNSPLEAYNDPNLTPQDIAEAYGTTEFAVMNSPLLGEDVLMYSPRARVSPFAALEDSKLLLDDNLYSERWAGKPFSMPELGDQSYVPTGRKLGQQGIDMAMNYIVNHDGVKDWYTDQIKAENPDMKEGTEEMLVEIENRINSEMLPWLKARMKSTGDKLFTQKAEPAAKEEGLYKKFNPNIWVSDKGNEKGVEFTPKSSISSTIRNVKLPKGTLVTMGSTESDPIKESVDAIEVSPVRFVWDKDKKGLDGAYFIYTSKYNPDKVVSEQQHTYKVKLNRESLANFSGAVGGSNEQVLEEIRKASTKDQVESINEFVKGLGIEGDVSDFSGEDKPTEYTAKQSSALAAFEKQLKRKPTQAELEKILEKYK